MEKRLALAFVLCFLLIIVHGFFFTKPQKNTAAKGDKKSSAAERIPGEREGLEPDREGKKEPKEDVSGQIGAEVEGAPSVEKAYASTRDLEIAEALIYIDTDIFEACFSNLGGVLKYLKFKDNYNDPEVLKDKEKKQDSRHWLEITKEIPGNTPAFALEVAGKGEDPHLKELDRTPWEHSVSVDGKELVFVFRASNGLEFRKTFYFIDGAHHMDIEIEVRNGDVEGRFPEPSKKLNLAFYGPCGIRDKRRASFTAGPMGVRYADMTKERGEERELQTIPAGELADSSVPNNWSKRGTSELFFAGIANNYFTLLLKPQEGYWVRGVNLSALADPVQMERRILEYRSTHQGANPPVKELGKWRRMYRIENAKADFDLSLKLPGPGEGASQRFMFFAGPKSTELMQQDRYAQFYQLILDSYGWMPWINTSLLWILKLFHSIFSNWGVAIVFLTLVVKIILFPLNRVQQVSMQGYSEKMKKLKPKLDEIKKKYKNNKKKFNEAQMKLMREEGVRPPLMGCLLIFLQFPIFIGLFQILRTAFELRHSPFCLWVNDLSQPDAMFPLPFTIPLIGSNTFNLLPILMTVAFYYQQKMMPKPSTDDPQAAQMQKIMKFMPILFGFMFYGYAAGLSLYWMTSNIISILEYKFIRKKFPVGGDAKVKTKAA